MKNKIKNKIISYFIYAFFVFFIVFIIIAVNNQAVAQGGSWTTKILIDRILVEHLEKHQAAQEELKLAEHRLHKVQAESEQMIMINPN